VFREVMDQVENFKENDSAPTRDDVVLFRSGEDENDMLVAAEDIFIYGSVPVDLPNTSRTELVANSLDLVLMYAIGGAGRKRTEPAGKIALGIKEEMLTEEQIAAYKNVKYILFHYWSNPVAYALTSAISLVDKDSVPAEYMKRQENGAVKYLLIEYNPSSPVKWDKINIFKTQRQEINKIRYLPFVTTLGSIQD